MLLYGQFSRIFLGGRSRVFTGVVSLDRYIPGCVRATRLARASPVATFVDYVEVVDNGVSARLNKERPRVLKGHIDDQIRGEVEGV